MSWGQCFAAESQPRVWAGALRSSVTRGSINASRRSGLSGVMARQRVREFYDRAGINRFSLGDFLTQRLNTRSHAGERCVDGLLVPVLNFLLDFPERTRHDLPLEVPLAADELGSGRAFTRYELLKIVAPTAFRCRSDCGSFLAHAPPAASCRACSPAADSQGREKIA